MEQSGLCQGTRTGKTASWEFRFFLWLSLSCLSCSKHVKTLSTLLPLCFGQWKPSSCILSRRSHFQDGVLKRRLREGFPFEKLSKQEKILVTHTIRSPSVLKTLQKIIIRIYFSYRFWHQNLLSFRVHEPSKRDHLGQKFRVFGSESKWNSNFRNTNFAKLCWPYQSGCPHMSCRFVGRKHLFCWESYIPARILIMTLVKFSEIKLQWIAPLKFLYLSVVPGYLSRQVLWADNPVSLLWWVRHPVRWS